MTERLDRQQQQQQVPEQWGLGQRVLWVRLLQSIFALLLLLGQVLAQGQALAGELQQRVAQFPQWQHKPTVRLSQNELTYPQWMAGTWTVTSTLVDMVAPLAPDVITPGFEGNRQFLHQPMTFRVRFVPQLPQALGLGQLPFAQRRTGMPDRIVADRAFNGLNLAVAYLGAPGVLSVTVDPRQPNRQITQLPKGRTLVSIVTGQASEQPEPYRFIATELCQQVFRGTARPYLNEVETTTQYDYQAATPRLIHAQQITAIYLSPQDPNYFQVDKLVGTSGRRGRDVPVALYRYQLDLAKLDVESG
jgi:hypothetical protein